MYTIGPINYSPPVIIVIHDLHRYLVPGTGCIVLYLTQLLRRLLWQRKIRVFKGNFDFITQLNPFGTAVPFWGQTT